jgi:transcriptional regulator with XRE-family HTH domain
MSQDKNRNGSKRSEMSLSYKIDRLFTTMHPKGRGEWTYREASMAIKAAGITISPSYIWQLRKGERTNPTLRQIEGLANFFHVPVTYFFGSTEQFNTIDAQLSLVRAMRDQDIRDIALRTATLTSDGLRIVSTLIDQLQTTQGMSKKIVPKSRSRRTISAPKEELPDETKEGPEIANLD